MIRVGTSGFSYKDWEGAFYPPGLPARDRLSFYAQRFATVEINASYYRVGTPRTYAAMAAKTPEGFRFVVKANKHMTHERKDNEQVFREFLAALQPLQSAGKFGCVLAQFPWSFKRTPAGETYLRTFRDRMEHVPTVIEFRNRQWCVPGVYELLRESGLGYCCVDEPQLKGLLPRQAVVTSSVGYVRFHGRNAKNWWRHDEAWERYDYLYSKQELGEWLPRLATMNGQAETLYVFFNNHYQGQAVVNAEMLRDLLSGTV